MISARSDTRRKILDRGVDLLSRVGLAGLSIGGLAGELGMSKSGLFAHFGSKEAVRLALLEKAASLAEAHVVAPAMEADAGLPRLRALIANWFGWTERAGLRGGCPVAAGLFELDDVAGGARDALVAMEAHWRGLLSSVTAGAVGAGHLAGDLDVDQFVWELCGIYLSHHASARFLRDGMADRRAAAAVDSLIHRSAPRRARR